MALLEVRGLVRTFGGVTAVDGVSFSVHAGELVSVIGPNGAGKTTLFNLITCLDQPQQGEVRLSGELISGLPAAELAGRGVARTFQHGRVFGNLSVLDNVLVGAHSRLRAARPRWPSLGGPVAELLLAVIPSKAVIAENSEVRGEAERILSLFGDRLVTRASEPAYSLSYANRRRLEIARALAAKPRLLLLDEPTAGMNPTETAEMLDLIRKLKESGLTILLIEHKLSLVMQLSDRVVVLDNGRKIAEGLPGEVRSNPAVVEAYLGHATFRGRVESRPSSAPELEADLVTA